eukprot:TRINITY_DN29652_c0_g1_i1.p1 TRINITY_DN29652_c0_g1~~TRINITY_DN29652_c0_g1_i1.p1  ORF type:complete len:181 (+),score=42.23 TRINITY_DN29652_c0_g1_i1:28-570(+)
MNSTEESSKEPDTLNKSHHDVLETIKDGWMLRDCETYKKEMKNCYALKSRFYQFYVDGKAADCDTWEKSFDDCKKWSRYADVEAANRIIAQEKERIKKRLDGHFNNKVWDKRTSPPEDWNAPLPDWFLERQKNSKLGVYMENTENMIGEDKPKQDENWLLEQVEGARTSVTNSFPSCSIL